jgi:hypothetical protein
MQLLTNPNLRYETITVAANTTTDFNCTGSLFLCKSATLPFKISINGRGFNQWDQGWYLNLGKGELFTCLTFQNTSTTTSITITFYVASEFIGFWPDRNVSTLNVGYNGTGANVISSSGKTFSGNSAPAGSGLRRQIIFQSVDASSALGIFDSSGNLCGAIGTPVFGVPGAPWTVESTDSFTIKAGTLSGGVFTPSGTCAVLVLEIYYTS